MVALPNEPIINDMYEAAACYERGPHRNYLGMSQIGKQCGRALWYDFRGFSKSVINGRAKMIFSLGDRVEEEVIKWLDGYRITDRQRNFVAINGFFCGHWDGCIYGVTSKPHVLEVKSANSRRFAAYKAQGIKDLSPEYWCQIQCYMGYSGIERGIFIVMNKDNCELYTERAKFNKHDFDAIERRARNIIYANEVPDKVTSMACEYCGYKTLCAEGDYIQTDCTCGTCKHFKIKDQKMLCTIHKREIEAQYWGRCCNQWSYIYGN